MRAIPPTNQKFKLIKNTNTFFRREIHIMIKKNYLLTKLLRKKINRRSYLH